LFGISASKVVLHEILNQVQDDGPETSMTRRQARIQNDPLSSCSRTLFGISASKVVLHEILNQVQDDGPETSLRWQQACVQDDILNPSFKKIIVKHQVWI